MKYSQINNEIILYHGTCKDSALSLMMHGWYPNSGNAGANMGQSKYLYVTNEIDNAIWFAREKGCDTVLKITIPITSLRVDPEDGTADTVEEELNNNFGLPAYLVCYKSLKPDCFEYVKL